ncbi:unnamed protein product [Strongylus vulgaris]|uniref:Secreted protein n=1 Tax=Strongylus vulgaris TaxID=40348 RepID=A0A3P7ISE9_STRVU|nr:unnamed protein product [Strongylus vulgaris]
MRNWQQLALLLFFLSVVNGCFLNSCPYRRYGRTLRCSQCEHYHTSIIELRITCAILSQYSKFRNLLQQAHCFPTNKHHYHRKCLRVVRVNPPVMRLNVRKKTLHFQHHFVFLDLQTSLLMR